MQNTIRVYKKWCKNCGICTAFCPKKALVKDEFGFPYLGNASLCNGCGLCELRCPDFAIVVDRAEKLGSTESKDEVKVSAGGKENAETSIAAGK
jgi:2-oxoglutarate ferredoxin oxidoreductase subunit delta